MKSVDYVSCLERINARRISGRIREITIRQSTRPDYLRISNQFKDAFKLRVAPAALSRITGVILCCRLCSQGQGRPDVVLTGDRLLSLLPHFRHRMDPSLEFLSGRNFLPTTSADGRVQRRIEVSLVEPDFYSKSTSKLANSKDAATNPRGIPYAPFIDKVEDYVTSRAEVEGTLKSFQEMISFVIIQVNEA